VAVGVTIFAGLDVAARRDAEGGGFDDMSLVDVASAAFMAGAGWSAARAASAGGHPPPEPHPGAPAKPASVRLAPPTLGRVVHVWTGGGWRAALVTRAASDELPAMALAFPDSMVDYGLGGPDETGATPPRFAVLRIQWLDGQAGDPVSGDGWWRWPPRVDA
jgi:hypothetical protein